VGCGQTGQGGMALTGLLVARELLQAMGVVSPAAAATKDGSGSEANPAPANDDGDDADDDALVAQAVAAGKAGAYSPYSKFRVGAAVLTEDGTVFTGSNVENASYGLTICAERTALCKAVSSGHKKFVKIAVACVDLPDGKPSSPCGACRQFMAEFGGYPVLMYKGGGGHIKTSVDELLPYAFRPAWLP